MTTGKPRNDNTEDFGEIKTCRDESGSRTKGNWNDYKTLKVRVKGP